MFRPIKKCEATVAEASTNRTKRRMTVLGVNRPSMRFVIGVVAFGIIAFALGVYVAKARLGSKPRPLSPYLLEGFDFTLLRKPDNDWRGPEDGTKIDLSRLKAQDGRTLASVMGTRPAVLVSVNSSCALCKTASDQMRYIRENLASHDIDYYMVTFASPKPNEDFFLYADSLTVGAPGFKWDGEAGQPNEAILLMTSPSHLLVHNDGTVICVWPGSYQDKDVRDRMAKQIVADTLVATTTRAALLPVIEQKH